MANAKLAASLQPSFSDPNQLPGSVQLLWFCWVQGSHDVLHRFGFDEDGDGVEQRQLQPLDGVPRHVQDAVFTLQTQPG